MSRVHSCPRIVWLHSHRPLDIRRDLCCGQGSFDLCSIPRHPLTLYATVHAHPQALPPLGPQLERRRSRIRRTPGVLRHCHGCRLHPQLRLAAPQPRKPRHVHVRHLRGHACRRGSRWCPPGAPCHRQGRRFPYVSSSPLSIQLWLLTILLRLQSTEPRSAALVSSSAGKRPSLDARRSRKSSLGRDLTSRVFTLICLDT